MKEYKEIQTTENTLYKTICDKCEKEQIYTDRFTKAFEPEMQHIEINFGFGSKMDGKSLSFDLCEYCLLGIIKDINYKTKKERFWKH